MTLTGTLLTPSDAEEAQLQALIDTVKRTNPDKAKHETTFDLDDLLTHLLEDDEAKSHVATRNNFACKDERARARGRAIVTLKLHSLFRSDCCRWMQRGVLFDDPTVQTDKSSSYWGPMSTLDDGTSCPEFVRLLLTQTKSSNTAEHIIYSLKSEPALCPVAALFTYVSMHKKLKDIVSPIDKTESIFLSVTKQQGFYRPIGTAQPVAKDTKAIMEAAGIDMEKFTSHSLRCSTASRLLEKGVPELNIIHHARWSGTSVFRKFYERANLKQISTMDLLTQRANSPTSSPSRHTTNEEETTTTAAVPAAVTPAVTGVPPLPPRINIRGPKGGALRVPNMAIIKGIPCHCSGCDEPDDHTMVWCRQCNIHMHASCFVCAPSEIESLHQSAEGWYCDECE